MKKYDVLGIGNALLDYCYNVDYSDLENLGLVKGNMCLINDSDSKNIFSSLSNRISHVAAGGSVSNTLAGLSILGSNTLLISKIGADENGKTYERISKESRVNTMFSIHPSEITGHAITFITPDYERTFAVNLGASLYLTGSDIDYDEILNSRILHIESYQLVGPDSLKQAILKATVYAKNNNVLISLDLSDSGIIKNNHSFFTRFVKDNVNILFANKEESFALTGLSEEGSMELLSDQVDIVVIKLGPDGSLINRNGRKISISAFRTEVINTAGAGDMYSAGFLYGLINNFPLEKSGEIASYASSLVVGSKGARIDEDKIPLLIRFRDAINNKGLKSSLYPED